MLGQAKVPGSSRTTPTSGRFPSGQFSRSFSSRTGETDTSTGSTALCTRGRQRFSQMSGSLCMTRCTRCTTSRTSPLREYCLICHVYVVLLCSRSRRELNRWSGLAMHPVERMVSLRSFGFRCTSLTPFIVDFIYYTCTLLPMVWSLHPFHFWMNKIHADISPLPGHDGHDAPAGGSFFHHIHHAK